MPSQFTDRDLERYMMPPEEPDDNDFCAWCNDDPCTCDEPVWKDAD